MPSISESLGGAHSPLADSLAAGIASLSLDQQVTFTTYARSTVPVDGYVFYVNTGVTTTVSGSLHYSIDREQNEDETNDRSRVIFTALAQIDVFNQVSPDDLFIGEWQGIRFAFSGRGPFYLQSGLYHYFGFKIDPALASQLIDSAAGLPTGPVVSNSLPVWLGLAASAATYPAFGIAPVYPSFLVPANIGPPYVVANVEADATHAAHFPMPVWPGTLATSDPAPLHALPAEQLCRDRVRLTMYGFSNQQAMQFYMSLVDYSLATDAFGFGNTPVIRDLKRSQAGLGVLAMKKTMDIEAWYYQGTADAIARRLILSAQVDVSAPRR